MGLSGGIASGAIVVGVFIAVISFLGCFGAANEKGMLLKTFFAMMLLLIILEIAVGISAYNKQDELDALVSNSWRDLASKSIGNHTRGNPLFAIESTFQCCGLNNVTDAAVPRDCVERIPDWNTPCRDQVLNSLSDSLGTIGATGITLGVIELVSLIFSAILFNRIAQKEKANGNLMNEAWRINRNKVQYGYQNYQYL